MNLTQKQRSILTVIVSFISTHKYSPSIQDICLYTGLKSSSTAHGYLERMRKLGYID
ncbi:LexA family protein [Paenibacillus agricola]